MLRPATPLTILLFASFVLLLISTLSTPIIKGIPIASFRNVRFGVFGYCIDGGTCSNFQIGYTTDGLFSAQDQADFNLPASARHSLSSLLIVHPVAAFCNLIVLALAIAAHFHSPSHSARYLLALLILLLPTLLITLLAFLVDILLFVPHLQWGGWIVLASTILITASGVVTCAMRRTLVSRKARKRRIAENAEMSGENFYGRQEQETTRLASMPAMSTESKVPLVNGSPGADKMPAFAAYDGNRVIDERQQVSQPSQNGRTTPVSPVDETNRYYASSTRSTSRPRPGETGIPLAPINTQASEGSYRPSQDVRGPTSYPPNAYGTRGGYGPPRGRSGPSPRGGFAPRGGYGPRGPPPQGYGRGGFGPEMRGNYGGRGRGGYAGGPMAGGVMMAGAVGSRGPPPPGYISQSGNESPQRYGPQSGYGSGPQANSSPYARGNTPNHEPVSPSQYTATDENATTYVAYSQQTQSPRKSGSLHSRSHSPAHAQRSVSPPPSMPLIGQAVTSDNMHHGRGGYQPDFADSREAQRGQGPVGSPQRERSNNYVPPRAQWNSSTVADDTLAHDVVTMGGSTANRPRVSSNASGSYYEDVDPRFAEKADVVSALPQRNMNVQQHQQPLMNAQYGNQNPSPETGNVPLPHSTSYEELPVGARSPAESDGSHFTSVSQRGVNPNWRPGFGGEFNNLGPRRGPQPGHDMLLANNPDFELVPPPGRFGVRGGRGGYRGGPMNVGPPGRMPPPSAMGMSGDSPYGPTTMREI